MKAACTDLANAQPADRNSQSVISFDLARLRAGVRPFRLHWFPRLRSTNDHAAVLRRRGEMFAPAIVLAGRQTAGRGRAGRSWWSGPGVITVTFVMPIQEHISPHQVPLIAGLAVRQAAAELAGEPNIKLKWPNDILFRGRKLAGLLCERIDRVDLIGLGMNLNIPSASGDRGSRTPDIGRSTDQLQPPPSLRPQMTFLAEIAGHAFDPTETLSCLARKMHEALSQRDRTPFPQLSREYDQHHSLIGRRISVLNGPDSPALTGRCEGIDSIGRLLLRRRGTLHRIVNGHIIG
jgi:BirA family transcriptional regulator, biotin operon repressor / biotin---[acetyl-CoA-carboxylase] ligase